MYLRIGLQITPKMIYIATPAQTIPAAEDVCKNLPRPIAITTILATTRIVPARASQCLDAGTGIGVFFLIASAGSKAL